MRRSRLLARKQDNVSSGGRRRSRGRGRGGRGFQPRRTQTRTQQPGTQQPGRQQPGRQQPGKQQPGKQQPGKKKDKGGDDEDEDIGPNMGLGDLIGPGGSMGSGIGPGGSMGSGIGPGGSMGLVSAGLGAAGAFAQGASEGTSPRELDYAMDRGTAKGQKAADAVANVLAAATSGSTQTTVSGRTSGVVPKHKKIRCPCPSNVLKYRQILNDLPKGLQKMIAEYYKVASRCNCKSDNEELAKYLLEKILKSKNILMSSGFPFSRTEMYKHLSKEAVAVGGTRKKSGHAMNKKSRTRKQQKTQLRQKTQSRRSTRKI